MDAYLTGTSQGYAAAGDVPYPITCNSLESHYESDLDSVFSQYIDPDFSISLCSDHDLYNGSSNASHALHVLSATCTPGAHSECKLQPRVFNRSPSISLTYTPPPSGQLVQLQYVPSEPLPSAMATAPIVLPPHDVAAPINIPCHLLHAHVDAPSTVGYSSKLSHFFHADVASYVNASNTPPATLNPSEFDAYPTVMGCRGNQLHDPPENFSFNLSHLEAKHKSHLPYDVFDGTSKLSSPAQHRYIGPKNPMKVGRPDLDVLTGPTVYQSGVFSLAANSESLAMEMSSASAPAALTTSNSTLLYRTSAPPEGESHTVPASPTPSVNKGASRREDSHGRRGSKVAFIVRTQILDLYDGFKWKKYGQKRILREEFPRSYFNCDEKSRCGCKVLKRTQKCDDDAHVVFTYLGRHNHPP